MNRISWLKVKLFHDFLGYLKFGKSISFLPSSTATFLPNVFEITHTNSSHERHEVYAVNFPEAIFTRISLEKY